MARSRATGSMAIPACLRSSLDYVDEMLRLFVGIEFPPELKLDLSLLCSGVPGARWVDPGNLHLTLRFIGEVPEDIAADVDEALAGLKARRFMLQLAGTGIF